MAQLTKASWLAEGKKLGANASANCWLIADWLVEGEQTFIGNAPSSKKEKRKFWATAKKRWQEMIDDAAKATSLRDATLRQYAKVARRGVRVEGLSFTHHLEVQRCGTKDRTKVFAKFKFDAAAARRILQKALDEHWTVAQTRAEVQRRFPTGPAASTETPFDKAKRMLKDIIKQVPKNEQLSFLDALAQEIPTIKNEVVQLSMALAMPTAKEQEVDETGMPVY